MGWWDDDWGDDWYDFGSLVVWTTGDSHHPHQSWTVLDLNLDVGKDQFSESLRCNFWAIAMGESPRGMVICDMASLKRPWLLGEDHETMSIYIYYIPLYIHAYVPYYTYIYISHLYHMLYMYHIYNMYHTSYYIITYICISITHTVYLYTFFDCYYYPSLPLLRLSWLSLSSLLSLL